MITGDVRNDVYVTLLSGDFERGAGKSYSLQVTMRACDDQGIPLKVQWVGWNKNTSQNITLTSQGLILPTCIQLLLNDF